MVVFGFNMLSDGLDRFFTFTSGVNDISYSEYKLQYYPEHGTAQLRQQGFDSIDGKRVIWRVRVYQVDTDGVLTWCAEQDKIFDERGESAG